MKMFVLVLAMFPLVARAQEDVNVCKIENCDTEENQHQITNMEGTVNFEGCHGDLIKLKFSPKREVRCENILMTNSYSSFRQH